MKNKNTSSTIEKTITEQTKSDLVYELCVKTLGLSDKSLEVCEIWRTR